jgi:hypothetical protein
MLDLIKNPIIIALFAGVATYLYMAWVNDQKYKKNPKAKKVIGVFTPLVVTVIVWLLAYGYFLNSKCDDCEVGSENVNVQPHISQNYKLVNANAGTNAVINSSSDSPKSYHLMNKGLNIPNNLNLPDVFIETLH